MELSLKWKIAIIAGAFMLGAAGAAAAIPMILTVAAGLGLIYCVIWALTHNSIGTKAGGG